MTSMRVAYGDSNVLRCTIQFAYDRFFTSYTKRGDQKRAVLNSVDDIVNTNDTKDALERQKQFDINSKDFSGQTIDPKYQIGDGAGFL